MSKASLQSEWKGAGIFCLAVVTAAIVLFGSPPLRATPAPGASALLDEDQVGPLADLAERLSADRSWLTRDSLKLFERTALSLDELFTDAPRYVSLDGVLYRVRLEQVGKLWSGFDAASDPFIVFLTHEVYVGLGEERALGYQAGREVIVQAEDFERTPAIALTLARAARETPAERELVVELGSATIALGKARPRLTLRPEGVAPAKKPALPRRGKSHCPGEVVPSFCSGSFLACPSPTYRPYFVVQAIRVFDNHEGCCFHGDPEVELDPLRLDSVTGLGGINQVVEWQFSGRWVTDSAGRSRFLPDVDDNGNWYNLNAAVFPLNVGQSWSALLVEDDDNPGVLKINPATLVTTKVTDSFFQVLNNVRRIDSFELLAFGILRDILGVGGDDDLYQPALGFTTGLFCNDPMRGFFPLIYTMSSPGQWDMQGYFACIDPACDDAAPPPGGGGGGEEPPPGPCPDPTMPCTE